MTVSTAKPSTYTVDTGATYCPDHLWMLDEGTGTTAADQGKHANARDLTIVGSNVTWYNDATHGYILQANSSNTDSYAHNTTAVDSTTSGCIVALVRKVNNPSATCSIMGWGHTVTTGRYSTMRMLTTGAVSGLYDDGPNANANNFTGDYADGNVNLVAVKYTDNLDPCVSVNGSTWDTGAGSITYTHNGTFDRFGLFAAVRPTVGEFCVDLDIVAAWVYVNDYSTWTDSWISSVYNSGDPWSSIGITTSSIQAFQYQNRVNTLLRM